MSLIPALNQMKGYDAFLLACRSDFDLDDDLFWFDSWGRLNSMKADKEAEWCTTYILRNLADRIIDKDVYVTPELRAILDLWGPDGMELCQKYLGDGPAKSRNAKRRRH